MAMARYILPSTATASSLPKNAKNSPAPILGLRALASKFRKACPIMAVASKQTTAPTNYPKVAAPTTGPIPAADLLGVIQGRGRGGTISSGITEGYWEYRLNPWDMAVGVLIVEEAGGVVSRMDGGEFTVFDCSVLVSSGGVHAQLLDRIGPATEDLKKEGIDFPLWFKPDKYPTDF